MQEPPTFTNQSPFTPLPTWEPWATCDWWNALVRQDFPHAWATLKSSHQRTIKRTIKRTRKYRLHQQRLSTKCPGGTLPVNIFEKPWYRKSSKMSIQQRLAIFHGRLWMSIDPFPPTRMFHTPNPEPVFFEESSTPIHKKLQDESIGGFIWNRNHKNCDSYVAIISLSGTMGNLEISNYYNL